MFTPRQLDNANNLFSSLQNSQGGDVTIVDQRHSNSPPPQVTRGRDGNVQILLRDTVRGMVDSGELDRSISRRFGLGVQP